MSDAEYDYIVVGSGAGGGPLAANLAKAGHKVLVMEAGGDACSESETGRLMYEVPIFHGHSTEYPECAWNYFVRHYTDDAQQAKDEKIEKIDGRDMVWYPRAGALGGCTSHNAMITVVPQDSDWNKIAEITGDDSWSADKMRPYFARLENCTYVPKPDSTRGRIRGFLSSISELLQGDEDWRDRTHGHGFDGWLTTSEADPKLVLKDPDLIAAILGAVKAALRNDVGNPLVGVETRLDPNDDRNASNSPEGLAFTPLAVTKGVRNGPRDYLLRVRKDPAFGNNLSIKLNVLATRVVFEGTRAVGVEYIDKAHVYRADPNAIANPEALPRATVRARKEVILACGAFNTPQLLMLSGIGRRGELERFGIPMVAELPGVGENLQDRYEVGVVSEFARDFRLLKGGTFNVPSPENPDPDQFLKQWLDDQTGVYATNGALVGIIKRSSPGIAEPDLYIFGLPGFFRGYQQGYSKLFEERHNRFTWAILKARTSNTGTVKLTSANPWDRPDINFKSFGDGARANDPDLEAVVSGMKFVRGMNKRLKALGIVKSEMIPGPDYESDDRLREFAKDEAWGHHASCTCKIGADDDPMAVLDSRFRVRKTQGLRVVDASVFPKIPGYFIVTPIYMISEKASDVISEDA
jgi:choline dehydrogenase